jgi:hypothetical protein
MTPEQMQTCAAFTRTELWAWVDWYFDSEFYYVPAEWIGVVEVLRKSRVK